MKTALELWRIVSRKGLTPLPKTTVSTWADEYRILSSTSAEPGRWKTSRAPYQEEIMNAFTQPGIRRVVVMSSSQVGKSDVLRSDLIQCNDGGQSVRRLDIWAFALWLSFCSHFFSSVIYGGRAIGGAYSINDEYPINDCFRVSLIGYGQSLKKFPYNTFK